MVKYHNGKLQVNLHDPERSMWNTMTQNIHFSCLCMVSSHFKPKNRLSVFPAMYTVEPRLSEHQIDCSIRVFCQQVNALLE